MKRTWFMMLLLTIATALSAQQPPITPETPVNYSILHQWLHSGDPRLIAWAADFARRTHDARILAEMPPLLEHWIIPGYTEDEPQAAQRRAAMAVLDTLIQENALVPIPVIGAVAESLPAQALILVQRHSLAESRSLVESWTYASSNTLVRAALMMLANEPGPHLVASVVSKAEAELNIRLTSSSSGHRGMFGLAPAGCGDRFPQRGSQGWPQVYAYTLEELQNDSGTNSRTIVELDGDRIEYRRFVENGGFGTCHPVRDLDFRTRHLLIAHWVGVPAKEMAWYPVEYYSVQWKDKESWQQQLGAIIEAERQKLRATVRTLRERNLLPPTPQVLTTGFMEDNTEPKLTVRISCELKPCPLD